MNQIIYNQDKQIISLGENMVEKDVLEEKVNEKRKVR